MLILTHTSIGITLGVVLGNPYIAAPLALASHYLVDDLPHFEVSSFRKPGETKLKPKNWFEVFFVLIDILASLFLVFYFQKLWSNTFFVGFIFAVVPDFLDNVFLWSSFFHNLPLFKQLYQLHKNFHFTVRGKKIWLGILSQIVIISLCVVTLKRLI